MKKKEIQNIVNEEVSKLQSIVIQEVRAHKSINEKIDKAAWDKANDDQRIGMLLTVVKDPDEAELHFEKEWNELPSEVTSNLQESVNESVSDFPMEFTLEKDVNYNSWGVHEDKLYKGTFVKDKIVSDHKKGVYVNHEGKQEVTLDLNDIRNLQRLGVTLNEAAAPKFTAKEFVEYVNDEFDSETLQLMQNVLGERLKFLDKMKDMANPRTVVQGYMRKDDLKENLGRYDVKLEEGAFSELQILADESSNFEEFFAKVKQEFPDASDEKMKTMLRSLYDDEYFKMAEEITKNPLDSGVFDTICEVAQMNGFDKKIDNKFRTSTALVLHISKQLSEEKRRDFVRDVRDIKNAFGIEEFVL
jgi:hypothetical protein